jgi:LPS-assembly protein
VTDIVGHVTYTPNPWIDFSTRERVDHQNFDLRFADALVTGGPSWLRLNAGYLYTTDSPYSYYNTLPPAVLPLDPRNEITVGASTSYGNWRAHLSARRNIATNQMDNLGIGGAYENECFIFDVEFGKRYTSLNGDGGSTSILFQITLKTVGTFGYSAD